MTRKHCERRVLRARPPAGLRAKFNKDTLQGLALIHIGLVDALVAGPELAQFWEWLGTVLAWSKVAQQAGLGEDEIRPVVELAAVLAARFEANGFVQLDDREIDIARSGAVVMDLLAQAVDADLAAAAARGSSEALAALRCQP